MNFVNGEKSEEDRQAMLKSALDVVERNKIHVNCFKKGGVYECRRFGKGD